MAHALFRSACFGSALCFAAAIPAVAAAPPTPHVRSGDLAPAALALHAGGRLRVADVEVPATSETLVFDLERFEVFTPDADIVVHGDGGHETHLPRPKTVYLKGSVVGEPDSRVFLESQPNGHVRGYVNRGEDEIYLVDNDQETAGRRARLQAERADNALLKAGREQSPWSCDEDALPPAPQALASLDLATDAAAIAPEIVKAGYTHTARVAVETDHEFFQKLGTAAAATAYIGNVIGYASSAVYQPEIATSLKVSSVSLWATTTDPWTQTTTRCALMEFGHYWNKNKKAASRTIAHFMSGKSIGGGIAWIGALCAQAFNASASCPGLATDAPWGGGYSFSGNLAGNFNINNPQVVWDIDSVAHEIGHNFNSPHSHCYGGIDGNSKPIDACYAGEGAAGCYSGTKALPGAGSLTGGAAGSHDGTIMSYCHLLSGGMGNINLTFGKKVGFTYGVQPAREASRMSSYVNAVAASNPTCLAPQP